LRNYRLISIHFDKLIIADRIAYQKLGDKK